MSDEYLRQQQQSYHAQVAQLRNQRAAQERTEQLRQIQYEYQAALQNRQAIEQRVAQTGETESDRADWNYFDQQVQQAERDYAAHQPVQPQQMDPRAQHFLRRRQAWIDRNGQNAVEAIKAADRYVTMPKNPRDPHPSRSGMGLQRYSNAYYRAMDDVMELHAGNLFNAPYDAKEKALTPDEAARISGLSNRDYNRAVNTLMADGRIYQNDK